MRFDEFYCIPTLTSNTADMGARAYNVQAPLSEAWRYPTRPAAEIEDEIRRMVGPDATIERVWNVRSSREARAPGERIARFEKVWIAVRVAVARCEAEDPTRWAHELAALDTRVYFTTVATSDDGSTRFEAYVWVANPHTGAPANGPFSPGTPRWEPGDDVSSGRCRCGAEHVGFFCSRREAPDAELQEVSIQCLACGRATLTSNRVIASYGYEIYLRDRLPLSRVTRSWGHAWRNLRPESRVARTALRFGRVLGVPLLGLIAGVVATLVLGRGC